MRNAPTESTVWLEIVTLLRDNSLELQVLDLSSNGIVLGQDDIELCGVLASSILKNTCLRQLNLSKNRFSSGAIDHLLERLSAGNDLTLAFLLLDDNSPPLSNQQQAKLSSFCNRSRKNLLQNFIHDREKHHEVAGVESKYPPIQEGVDSVMEDELSM